MNTDHYKAQEKKYKNERKSIYQYLQKRKALKCKPSARHVEEITMITGIDMYIRSHTCILCVTKIMRTTERQRLASLRHCR